MVLRVLRGESARCEPGGSQRSKVRRKFQLRISTFLRPSIFEFWIWNLFRNSGLEFRAFASGHRPGYRPKAPRLPLPPAAVRPAGPCAEDYLACAETTHPANYANDPPSSFASLRALRVPSGSSCEHVLQAAPAGSEPRRPSHVRLWPHGVGGAVGDRGIDPERAGQIFARALPVAEVMPGASPVEPGFGQDGGQRQGPIMVRPRAGPVPR